MSIRSNINFGNHQSKVRPEDLNGECKPVESNRATTSFFVRLKTVNGAQWRKYRKAIVRCRNHFSKTSVHEVRVSIRRLVATLELLLNFKEIRELKRTRNEIEKQLKWLSPLRDIQVQRGCLHAFLAKGFNLDTYLKHLDKREAKLIRRLRKKLGKLKPEKTKIRPAQRIETVESETAFFSTTPPRAVAVVENGISRPPSPTRASDYVRRSRLDTPA